MIGVLEFTATCLVIVLIYILYKEYQRAKKKTVLMEFSKYSVESNSYRLDSDSTKILSFMALVNETDEPLKIWIKGEPESST